MHATPYPSTGLDPSTAARRDTRWLLVLLVVLGLLLRWPLMGRSIWFDEACMSDQRIGTLAQLLATLYVDIHPPLYVTFMHCWNGLFGDGELSMRLPPLVSGLASIPLLFWVGERLVGRRAALWAAMLLTVSPVHVWYSCEARLYAPMVASTLIAVGTCERLIDPARGRQRGLWWLHAGNLAVMLTLHYYLAVYVVLLAVMAPLLHGFTRPVRRLIIWHVLAMLLLGAFVVGKLALSEFPTDQGYMRAMTLGELYEFVFGWCWTGNTLQAAVTWIDDIAGYVAQGLGVVLLLVGLVACFRARRDQPTATLVPVCLLAIPLYLLGAAAAGFDRTYIERSALPALPFVLLLAGKGLTSLPMLLMRWTSVLLLVLTTASLIALFRFQADRWTVYKPNSDWRAATGYLSREIEHGGAGRPVFTPTPNPRPLSYYDARIQDEKNLLPATDPAQIGAKVGKRLGNWLGGCAERVFRDFADGNAALLGAAKMRVYRTASDPAALRLDERMRDDICYLVRDHWHPDKSVDSTLEALLRHARTEVLERHSFTGITVHKVRIRP